MTAMTCTNAACTRCGVVIEVDLAPLDLETGAPITVTTVHCGVCSDALAEVAAEQTEDSEGA